MDHGKIIASGTKEELFKLLEEENNITIIFKNDFDFENFQITFSKYQLTQVDDKTIIFSGSNIIENLSEIILIIKKMEIEIKEIDFAKPNLEKLFLKLTGRELRDE
jgi:ABC-2 type transport system ATP-binding protein